MNMHYVSEDILYARIRTVPPEIKGKLVLIIKDKRFSKGGELTFIGAVFSEFSLILAVNNVARDCHS